MVRAEWYAVAKKQESERNTNSIIVKTGDVNRIVADKIEE